MPGEDLIGSDLNVFHLSACIHHTHTRNLNIEHVDGHPVQLTQEKSCTVDGAAREATRLNLQVSGVCNRPGNAAFSTRGEGGIHDPEHRPQGDDHDQGHEGYLQGSTPGATHPYIFTASTCKTGKCVATLGP